MVNRRGAIFNRTLFRYAEISDLERAADDLLACGQARTLKAEDYSAFVACLPKDVLVAGAKAAGRTDIRVSWPKAKLVDYFLTQVPFEVAAEHCGAAKFIALDDVRPLEFLLYLYFGKTEDDLKNFALRDLGIMRTNKATSFKARFTDGDEARACFHYSRLLDRHRSQIAGIYQDAVADIFGGPDCPSDYAADLRSRAAWQVGQFFEKLGETDLARQLYRAGSSPECNERLVRLLYGAGDKADAEDLLRRMIDDPASDGEFVFATDFYARKFGGRRTGSCTELLRAGVTLTVDDVYRGNPEAGVAGVMRRRGYRVFFAENTLWHSLFGLLFWDELFESESASQQFRLGAALPQGPELRASVCRPDRRQAGCRSIRKCVSICCCARSLRTGAVRTASSPGITSTSTRCGCCCREPAGKESRRSSARCARTSATCATDFRISCWRRTAPSPSWRSRPKATLSAAINSRGCDSSGTPASVAEIGRVDYRFDPEQDYVVVDVETTGSWASGDRITEIGAVKIRNHQVVDEWHSLVNPQRAIPARITQITNITNEMVRDAPIFSEIADSFMRFMGDGIFVAHNVNFDYGFISYEYERLERRFRFPKLCTVAGMRRRYPGHKSYGLGKLCEFYGIELKTHHRALCDARATSHLLNLINQKREAALPSALEDAA